MSEIVNLRRARKTKAASAGRDLAAENRARHGRSKAERARDAAERDALSSALDGARRNRPTDRPPE